MIINPFSSIPVHAKSHVRGWAKHWADSLNTTVANKCIDYSNSEKLYIDHGANYSGGLNLFGGVTDNVFENLNNLISSNAEIFSLDIEMPEYAAMLRKRIGQSTCHKDLPLIIDKLQSLLESSKVITQYDIESDSIAIGDSHSVSYAIKNSAVIRKNGQTLHGALNSGFIQESLKKATKKYSLVTLCLGSIDIRHHLMRFDNPIAELELMLDKYVLLATEISENYGCEVNIAAPHPIESESRRIPQTGFYKGTPFYGSINQRQELVKHFIEHVGDSGVKVVHQPLERYEIDPEQYSKGYMELGSSVHLAPIHYRSNSDWGA